MHAGDLLPGDLFPELGEVVDVVDVVGTVVEVTFDSGRPYQLTDRELVAVVR